MVLGYLFALQTREINTESRHNLIQAMMYIEEA